MSALEVVFWVFYAGRALDEVCELINSGSLRRWARSYWNLLDFFLFTLQVRARRDKVEKKESAKLAAQEAL